MHSTARLILLGICFVGLIHSNLTHGTEPLLGASSSQLNLTTDPSSVVIKVGDEATINLTVTGGATYGTVCFSEQGFPSSGFTLTYLPTCAFLEDQKANAQLTVEATPAAAPQNFTALILASVANLTASAPLTVTVVPAIAAWIPWSGIVLFFLVIGAALFIGPRHKKKGKGKMDG
jgi:hypothetical protein